MTVQLAVSRGSEATLEKTRNCPINSWWASQIIHMPQTSVLSCCGNAIIYENVIPSEMSI